ncbi:hypothetical protein HK099_007936 [Clydaea vesicula]|uniref:Pentatricopeptide repeat-containing protein n=1 Tax=Clydaea vesicula TaxID=447962 RepID=A0AAD5TWA4_9FUNG|nr:hypothetical protein HK099_007936 [Clydaea vesicula]
MIKIFNLKSILKIKYCVRFKSDFLIKSNAIKSKRFYTGESQIGTDEEELRHLQQKYHDIIQSTESKSQSTNPKQLSSYKEVFKKLKIPFEVNKNDQNEIFNLDIGSQSNTFVRTSKSVPSSDLSILTKKKGKRRAETKQFYNDKWWYSDLNLNDDADYVNILYIEKVNLVKFQNLYNLIKSENLNVQSKKKNQNFDIIKNDLQLFLKENKSFLLYYLNKDQIFTIYKTVILNFRKLSITREDIHKFFKIFLSNYEFNKRSEVKKIDENRCLEIFVDMKNIGIDPNHETFGLLFKAFKNSPLNLQKIHSYIMVTTLKIFQPVFKFLYLKGRIHEEKELGEKFSDIVSEKTFLSLLAGAVLSAEKSSNKLNLDLIQNIFYDLKTANIDLSMKLAVGLIRGFQLMDKERGLKLLMKLHLIVEQRSLKFPWNRHLIDALMEAYAGFGSHNVVQSLMEKQKRICIPSMENYQALMVSHTQAKKPVHYIFELVSEMELKNIPRNDVINEIVLKACVGAGNLDYVKKTQIYFQSYIENSVLTAVKSVTEQENFLTTFKKNMELMDATNIHLEIPKFSQIFKFSTTKTHFNLIVAFCKLGDIGSSLKIFNQWKEIRNWISEVQVQRDALYQKFLELEKKVSLLRKKQIIKLQNKETNVDDALQQENIDDEDKNMTTSYPPPPLFVLASIVRLFGVKGDFSSCKTFFQEEIFNKVVTRNLFERKLEEMVPAFKLKQEELENDLNLEIKKMRRVNKYAKPEVITKAISSSTKVEHLEVKLKSLKKNFFRLNLIKGENFNIGERGLFNYIYSEYNLGWKQNLTLKFKVDEENEDINNEFGDWKYCSNTIKSLPKLEVNSFDEGIMKFESEYKALCDLEFDFFFKFQEEYFNEAEKDDEKAFHRSKILNKIIDFTPHLSEKEIEDIIDNSELSVESKLQVVK